MKQSTTTRGKQKAQHGSNEHEANDARTCAIHSREESAVSTPDGYITFVDCYIFPPFRSLLFAAVAAPRPVDS